MVAAMLVATMVVSCSRPEPGSAQYLMREILSKIDSSDIYIASVEAQLEESRLALEQLPRGSMERYDACMDLGLEYSKFVCDSAIVSYGKAAETAREMGDEQLYYKAVLEKGAMLTHTGFYFAANSIFQSIPREKLDRENLIRYFNNYKRLYHDSYLDLDTKPEIRAQFVKLYQQYRDSALALMPPDNYISLREQERICARAGDYSKALEYNYRRLESIPPGPGRAGVLYDRYIIYHHYMGRPCEDHVELLLESALYDVVSANQDIASFRYVEYYLISIGEIKEAKKISDYYYATMVRLGSRSRLLLDTEPSRGINEEYFQRLARQNREIQVSLLIIALLSILLAVIVVQQIRSRNKIIQLNKNLERSGKVANSYMLGFFQLYSSYISRLLALRSKINTNVRKGNTKLILNLTDPSKDVTSAELRQMYQNFDEAFLDIFPNYVQDFNSMLKPESVIVLKPGELLNTELRIFAVIKLGITDSSKISELLHCSIKTVYNKRSEINTKLAVPRDVFVKKLAEM